MTRMQGNDGRPLAICYGTRPQVIKASVLIDVLEEHWPLLTVDTGQHYDYELNALLYEQLGVRPPQLLLGIGSGDHATQTSAILTRAADIFAQYRPWAVAVVGDTNSTLGCALAAAKRGIPVLHVEAGLRSDNLAMAEEINRRLVDSISTLLFAPSTAAVDRLRAESPYGAVVRTGDVARDVLVRTLDRAPTVSAIEGWPLEPGAEFIFATLHRAELTDDADRTIEVLETLARLEFPVIFAMHPRTRATLERHGLLDRIPAALHVRPPLGYLETLACIREARGIITDSGGVQREAYWLGTPCITLRTETEWLETVDLGANALVAPERAAATLPEVVRRHIGRTGDGWDRDAYGAGDAALRIRDAIGRWREGAPLPTE
ncbi:MAG TPA: UDP-N-acetylglucosamine 2-epimerase (non-hydrolyzing) [Longimicrobiales bacterium]